MTKPDYIASDIHLGAVSRETERAFVRFLEHVGAHGSTLLLVGDLFDFWFEYGDVVPGRHFRVLAGLAALVEGGVPVTLMGGNHDAWGGAFLREQVGVAYHPGHLRMEIGGSRALIAHGDGVGRGDLGYRALKMMIRNRATVAAFRMLHPELGMRIARAVSSTEGKAEADVRAEGRARHIEAWARERLDEEPELDLVICGHSHIPAVIRLASGQHYLNSGDWITHRTYLTLTPGALPSLHEWPAQGTRA